MLTLRQLRYFAALAETGHFGRAAERSAVTQPALSVQIRDLEHELGLSLVERRSSGAVLTVEGEAVAERARAILAAVRDLGDYALHQNRLATGPLRLGAIPSVAPYFMPGALQAVSERFPDLELSLRETITDTLVAALAAGDLDVVVLALPIEHPDVETAPLFEDRFLLAESAGRPERERAPTFDDLAGERLLLLEEGHCLREQALSLCGRTGGEGIADFGASSLATVLQMVAAGYGVTLLPELAVDREVTARLTVRLSRFAPPEPSRTIGLAWRRNSPRRSDLAGLVELLRGLGSAPVCRDPAGAA